MIKDKKLFSWALYDWANSTYSTTVMAVFFPLFFKNYWSAGTDSILTTTRLGSAISISSLLVALLSPTLGAMADLRSHKKLYTFLFMILGSLCCVWMFFIGEGQWWPAILAYSLSMMAFNASVVFNDALLPSVAQGKKLDYASSLGYSLGYLGGGILLTVNVLMYLMPEKFGLKDGVEGVKYSFLSVGIWWFVFTLPMMKYVPEPKESFDGHFFDMMKASLKSLKATLLSLVKEKNILLFVIAYWLYIDGVYTVMTMAVDYGMSLKLESKDLIIAILLTQYIGFPSAWAVGALSERYGWRKPILLICIGIYSLTVILATQMSTAMHFYALASIIGLVQGGVQSLSRSFFAQMIPANASGEYFGIFNLVGKFASILGPAVVGITVYMTGEHRYGMVGLLVLFAVGGALLVKVREVSST